MPNTSTGEQCSQSCLDGADVWVASEGGLSVGTLSRTGYIERFSQMAGVPGEAGARTSTFRDRVAKDAISTSAEASDRECRVLWPS
jgi:hypothetical protein